ncbi:TonB-dependent receptor domain-containing protein [Formosa algae]|uniref:Outer membrane receptor protein involved in Fe transport n=1 Tax=Formosa algae TaxID=225843 RepID=A0A9X0YL69_9FLAO|nr:TonB-dependent receptor [Formosa algae]MBP1839998.1 outer membrane receptor protein involved in Fe transport [Formosa algae]MDQ0335597.1 outer membrane receptor protein involved in Fe transport [Formosa algae]OEI81708.1 TonB-dependent receptor [Formosa algae]
MNNSKKIITFLLIISNSLFAFSQITGKIVDEANLPLEYATVALYNQNNKTLISGVITDSKGDFEFKNIKKGTFYIEASFIGYEVKTINNITILNTRETKDLGQLLLTLGTNLDEVVIQGERSTVVNKIDRQVFDAETFTSAQGGSTIDVIRNLPSVSIDGQGEISVRGSSGFTVLLNGKPVQSNASTIMAQLPANAVERVEVITAPSAKYDPEGKAGILNIITKKGALDGAFAQLNIKGGFPSIETYGNDKAHQRYGIDATYNVRNEIWNVSLSANYQRNDLGGRREGDAYTIIDDVKTQFPSTGERSFDEVNYSGRFSVDFTPDTTNVFSLGLFAGKRSKERLADIVYYDNHAVSPADSDNRLYTFQYYNHNLRERKSDFALGSLDYTYTFKNTSKLSTSALYEYTLLGGPTVNQNLGYPDHSILYQDEYNTNENPLHGIRLQLDYTFKPFTWGVLDMGYQYRHLDHTGDFVYERRTDFDDDFELVPEFSSEVDLERTIHAFYTQFSGKSGLWNYAAGARIEVMDRTLDLKDKANTVDDTYEYDITKLYPSASLQYEITDKTNIKAAYSKRVERTSTFQMNPFPEREHSETLEQGDPELKPEFIDLVELGVTKKLKNGQSVFATAYYRNVKNVVNRVNTVYNDTILNRIYSNVGDAKTIGLELGAEIKPTKNWNNFIGANIYNYKIDGEFDDQPIHSEATQYSINFNSTYSFWENASLQFTFNYLSERVTAQGEDSRFYSPNLTFQKSFLNNRLTATLQWQNIDMGLLDTNEQRITTYRPNDFYTTTNYIYEVDMVLLNLSYTFKNGKNKSKFINSEFGKNEF